MTASRWSRRCLVAAAVTAFLSPVGLRADDREHEDHELDAIQAAVAAGRILSLEAVLDRVRGRLPGRVVGIDIEREKGRWIYEFKVIDSRGRRREVYVDAADATIVKVDD